MAERVEAEFRDGDALWSAVLVEHRLALAIQHGLNVRQAGLDLYRGPKPFVYVLKALDVAQPVRKNEIQHHHWLTVGVFRAGVAFGADLLPFPKGVDHDGGQGNVTGAGFPFFNLYRRVVILRGEKLIEDVSVSRDRPASLPARLAMGVFSVLFHLNLDSSRWGWQMIGQASVPKAAG